MPKFTVLTRSGLFFLWLSFFITAADTLTKRMAELYLFPYQSVPVFSFFNWTLAYNTGAAFNFLAGGSFWPNLLFGGIALTVCGILLVWLFRLPRAAYGMNIALALILGGALGNLLDRICHRHVIDFIEFHLANWYWPVFNLADAA